MADEKDLASLLRDTIERAKRRLVEIEEERHTLLEVLEGVVVQEPQAETPRSKAMKEAWIRRRAKIRGHDQKDKSGE